MTSTVFRAPGRRSLACAAAGLAAALLLGQAASLRAQDAGSPAAAVGRWETLDTADRPQKISVTEVDRLKADPYAFYARKMLALMTLDPVDAEPTAAWRGSAVHAVLEAWMKEDDCDPARLRARADALLEAQEAHPLMRALWQPLLSEAIDFIAGQVEANQKQGRRPLAAERWGAIDIAGVGLGGKFDRIDRMADGGLAIVDYKTGQPPRSAIRPSRPSCSE